MRWSRISYKQLTFGSKLFGSVKCRQYLRFIDFYIIHNFNSTLEDIRS